MTRSLLAVAACCLLAATAHAGPSEDLAKQTRDDFNTAPRMVRADHLLLPLNYLEVNGASYGYHLPRRFERLALAGETFRIRKLKRKGREYRVEVESGGGARIRLTLFDAGEKVSQELLDQVFPRFLADVFVFGEAPTVPRIVVNTVSGLAHRGSCNHLPPPENRRSAASLDGLRPCPACFPADPPLPYDGYMPARTEATEQARLFLLAFPPLDDPAVQDRVAACGEAVVGTLPMDPLGLDYQFVVVHSNLMQAVSFATGFVFVTDRLMDAVESEAELAFVLAHEVAHCELFLPPAPVPGLTLPGSTAPYGDPAAIDRWRETIADVLAARTVARLYGDEGSQASLSILRKLQFANEALPHAKAGHGATHPTLGQRVAFFERDAFFAVGTDQIFQGLDDDGEALYTVRVLGGGNGENGFAQLFVLLESSDLANKDIATRPWGYKSGVGRIRSAAGKNYELQNHTADYNVPPGARQVLLLYVHGVDRKKFGTSDVADTYELDPGRLSHLEILNAPDVDRWILATED